MEYAYRAETWQALYTAVASSAAALTGLLFLALSLNLRIILKNPTSRGHAREMLGAFISLLVLSIIMLIPGQDRRVLGTELIAESLALVIASVILQTQTLRRIASERRVHRALHLSLTNLGTISMLIAGISLIVGQFGGLFWLVPTILIYLVWSLYNAWLLVVQAAEEEA